MKNKWLAQLRSITKIHMNWLTLKFLGTEALSKSELAELKDYGKLSIDDDIGLIEKSYILGRLRAILPYKEYKEINLQNLEEIVKDAKFTPLEELSIQEAKLHAALYVKGLTDDIAAGVFKKLNDSLNSTLTEHTIREVIRDQTALAIQQKKNNQQFASSLVKELKTDWSRNWQRLAATELHRAKVSGSAMAIINKLSVYKDSEGIESRVSIIPGKNTCEDCSYHYLGADGNPLIFNLSDLVKAGSNGASGTKHTRSSGIHNHWKTTLPPLHPNCFCQLVYIPAGMGWVDGKLVYTDMSKAVDRGSLSATIKPPGPKSTQGGSAPKLGSSIGSGKTKAAGPSVEWEYWSGPGQPPSEGGWERSEQGAWRRVKGSGGRKGSPEQKEAERQLKVQDAKQWGHTKHDVKTVMSHLSEGKIIDVYQLSKEEGGVNTSYRISIEGNGRGLMKPPQKLGPSVTVFKQFTEGCGTVMHGTQHKREQAAYSLFSSMGLTSCPPTTERMHEGEAHSVQQWKENAPTAWAHFTEKGIGDIGQAIAYSKNPAAMKEKVFGIVAMDIVMNSNDRHDSNVLIGTDEDVHAIDHGVSFGNSMMGYKNVLHRDLHSAGFKVKIPESLQKQFKSTSFGDLKRALGDKLADWEVGQTFLRMQYAMHLQETDGFLDYNKFVTDKFNVDGFVGPYEGMQLGSSSEGAEKAKERYLKNERTHELFEKFAVDYLDKVSADSSHPHNTAAKEIKELGVFMGPGFVKDPIGYRKSGEHIKYEESIRTGSTVKEFMPSKKIDRDRTVPVESEELVIAPVNKTTPTKKMKKSLYLSDKFLN